MSSLLREQRIDGELRHMVQQSPEVQYQRNVVLLCTYKIYCIEKGFFPFAPPEYSSMLPINGSCYSSEMNVS